MSAVKENTCIFDDIFNCYNKNVDLVQITKVRLESVIKCSKERRDDRHYQLDTKTVDQKDFFSHPSCLKSYTSRAHIGRYLKRNITAEHGTERQEKKTRRSLQLFDFKLHCIFCGELCNLVPDKKNPKHWRKAFICRTSDRGKGNLSFKNAILETCEHRNDE